MEEDFRVYPEYTEISFGEYKKEMYNERQCSKEKLLEQKTYINSVEVGRLH